MRFTCGLTKRRMVWLVRAVAVVVLVMFVVAGVAAGVGNALRTEPKWVSVEAGLPERSELGMETKRPPAWSAEQLDSVREGALVTAALPGGSLEPGEVVAVRIGQWPDGVDIDLGSASGIRLSWYADSGEFRLHDLDTQGGIVATTTRPWLHPGSGTTVRFVALDGLAEVWLDRQFVGEVPLGPAPELRVIGDVDGVGVEVEFGSIS